MYMLPWPQIVPRTILLCCIFLFLNVLLPSPLRKAIASWFLVLVSRSRRHKMVNLDSHEAVGASWLPLQPVAISPVDYHLDRSFAHANCTTKSKLEGAQGSFRASTQILLARAPPPGSHRQIPPGLNLQISRIT